MELSEEIKQKIRFVAGYIDNQTDHWLTIKRELLNMFLGSDRKKFSTRHPTTLKQMPNEFDNLVMNYWKEITGVMPIIKKEELHSESGYVKPTKEERLKQITDIIQSYNLKRKRKLMEINEK